MNQSYKKAFLVLTSLFFTWGLITVFVDPLIPRLKEVFDLSHFQSGFVQIAFFLAYGLVSIPAGNILHKIGYKKGIMLGLGIMGLGCLLFLPAASMRLYPIFLIALFTLASGMTILQVAANPYVTVLGDEKTASSRLNLAQAFNSLGTILASIIGTKLILSDKILSSDEIGLLEATAKDAYYTAEASALQTPFLYIAIALIVLAAIVFLVKLPKVGNPSSVSNYSLALKDKKLVFGAIGIFVYVGVEVAIGSYLTNYFMDMNLAGAIKDSNILNSIVSFFHSDPNAIDEKAVVGTFVFFYWAGAMIGRFVGSALMARYKPNDILSLFATLAIIAVIISISTTGFLSMWSIIIVGLFNSIMFPTIFSLAIEDLGDLKPQGSGILCTAIVGGAVIPPMLGFIADGSGFKIALLLGIVCYGYILFYGRKTLKLSALKK